MASERPKHWIVFDKITDRTMHGMVFAAIWVIVSIVGLLCVGFRSPSTKYWIIAIVVFPFLHFALETAGELFRRMSPVAKAREAIGEVTEGKTFSGLRVLYLFIETLVLLCLIIGVWYFGRLVVNRWFL